MSFNAIRWAWQQELKAGVKIVLLALADYADEEGICFPSSKKLAVKCGISRSTLFLRLKYLHQLGLLSIEQKNKNTKQSGVNLYRLNFVIQNLSKSLTQSVAGCPNPGRLKRFGCPELERGESGIRTSGGPRFGHHITYHRTNQLTGSPKSGHPGFRLPWEGAK